MHGVCWGYWNLISIHAPPRGATLLVVFGAIVTIISIHAPPRGATCITASSNSSSAFQFTPLREGRRATKQGGGSVYDISIHAPPRGATAVQHGGADARHFNSRPSARGDNVAIRASMANLISIHAPPRGATAKDMQFLQIFCSTLTNQHGLTIVPRNLSRLFW